MKGLIRNVFLSAAVAGVVLASASAHSALFWKTGEISRTLTHSDSFGGCMIQLTESIGNGCPDNGWVSLDCEGETIDSEDGKRAYATSLVALTLNKTLSVQIDNTLKVDGYCVAKRIDIR